MTDFPAAHSMDTTWFAIDADGCVGIFDSGEGGAVPEDLNSAAKAIEFESELLEVLAIDNGKYLDREAIDLAFIRQHISMENLLAEIDSTETFNQNQETNCAIYGMFLIVSTPTVIAELQQYAEVVIELGREARNIILYSSKCNPEWLRSKITSGEVLAGSREFDLEYHLNLLGWYHYGCGEQYPHTYDRESESLPKKPILLKDLPPEISDRLRLVRFDNLRFAEHNSIQPIEHMPCNTWDAEDWQGTDGKWYEGFPDYSTEPEGVPRSTCTQVSGGRNSSE